MTAARRRSKSTVCIDGSRSHHASQYSDSSLMSKVLRLEVGSKPVLRGTNPIAGIFAASCDAFDGAQIQPRASEKNSKGGYDTNSSSSVARMNRNLRA